MKRSGLMFGLFIALVLQAEVRLPAVFSDHMVLQRSIVAPVWGWVALPAVAHEAGTRWA